MRSGLILVPALLSAISLVRAEPPTLVSDPLADTYCAKYTQGETPDTALCGTLAQATSILYYVSNSISGNVELTLNSVLAFLSGDSGPLDGIIGQVGGNSTLSTLLGELLGNLDVAGTADLSASALAQPVNKRQVDALLAPLLDALLGKSGLVTQLLNLVGQLLGLPNVAGDASTLVDLLQNGKLQDLLTTGALNNILKTGALADLLANPDIARLVSSGELGSLIGDAQLDSVLQGLITSGAGSSLPSLGALDPTVLLDTVKGLLEALLAALAGVEGGAGLPLPLPLPLPVPELPIPAVPGLGGLPLKRRDVANTVNSRGLDLVTSLLGALLGPKGLVMQLLNAVLGLVAVGGLPGVSDLGALTAALQSGDLSALTGALDSLGGLDGLLGAAPDLSGLLGSAPDLDGLIKGGDLFSLLQGGALDSALAGLIASGELPVLGELGSGLPLDGVLGLVKSLLKAILGALGPVAGDGSGLPLPLPVALPVALPLERRTGQLGQAASALVGGLVGNVGHGASGLVKAVPALLDGVTQQCRCDLSHCFGTLTSSLQAAAASDDEATVGASCRAAQFACAQYYSTDEILSVIPQCDAYLSASTRARRSPKMDGPRQMVRRTKVGNRLDGVN